MILRPGPVDTLNVSQGEEISKIIALILSNVILSREAKLGISSRT